MRVFEESAGTAAPPRGAVATIGNYDGIHRGQSAVLEVVIARARAAGRPSLAITFEPHPLHLLAPDRAPARLTTPRQRERLLGGLGLDALLVLPFTAQLAAQPAELFVRQTLAGRLAIHELHVGSRFAFGRHRQGDLALLERLGAALGFTAFGVPELELDGAPVSATRIRQAIATGEVGAAARLLGRPWAVTGRVVAGDRAGTRLGFPTLNLAADHELLPLDGVYVTTTTIDGEAGELPGVSNVGRRPTLHAGGARLVETHLFDVARDLYGREVEVSFLRRLREERRFDGFETLRAQIARDVETGREYFRDARRSHPRAGEDRPAG